MSDEALPEEDNKLRAERRRKLQALRERDEPAFPNDFRRNALAAELHSEFEGADREAVEKTNRSVAVAGRLMTKRVMGKASFATIQDRSGQIQLFVQRNALGEEAYEDFKAIDLGDIVGGAGRLFRTKTGELSVWVDELRLLTKALRPLPEKFHGLRDTETRYRQRYLDLIFNQQSRNVFAIRAHMLRFVRSFMEAPGRDFVEVETPMMHYLPGGAVARPFETHHNALDIDLFLRVAPELYLKRLVVGGLERVYELNRNFRNEGVSTRHNPEFTMLEFYQAFADYRTFLDLIETMLREMALAVLGHTELPGGIDLGPPFRRISMREAVAERFEQARAATSDAALEQALRAIVQDKAIQISSDASLGSLLYAVFEAEIEPHLVPPTFVTQFPIEVSPLARRNDSDPRWADRFELFIDGKEIANGFSELNDPEDQAERFRAQAAARTAGDSEAMFYDSDYIRALEYGLPPTAGAGIGIDRLVMLFTGAASIRDVLLFPYMRPESEP